MKGPALFVTGLLCGALAMAVATWNATSPTPATATEPTSRPALPSVPSVEPASAPDARDAAPVLAPPRDPLPAVATSASSSAPALAATVPQRASGSAPAPEPLLIPVAGVTAAQLSDTFSDARGAGRGHDAIDIMAASGTPVVAVSEGTIAKLFLSEAGGLTIYQFDAASELAYYYAHLERYADGLEEGQAVARGQLIGYVGYSGNANPSAPHLHFAVFLLGPDKRWWQGEAINPYPLLRKH